MGEIFLRNKDNKFGFKPSDWRMDQSYRKAFCERMYANVDNAQVSQSDSDYKIIHLFKNNTKILVNGQSRSMKFKNSDLIKTVKKEIS